jgi:hypothetical protein
MNYLIKQIHIIYEFMHKIAAINPLTPPFFAATATTEETAAANIAGVTVIAAGASAGAEASTTSDISSHNTALIFPSALSEILTPDAKCAVYPKL